MRYAKFNEVEKENGTVRFFEVGYDYYNFEKEEWNKILEVINGEKKYSKAEDKKGNLWQVQIEDDKLCFLGTLISFFTFKGAVA